MVGQQRSTVVLNSQRDSLRGRDGHRRIGRGPRLCPRRPMRPLAVCRGNCAAAGIGTYLQRSSLAGGKGLCRACPRGDPVGRSGPQVRPRRKHNILSRHPFRADRCGTRSGRRRPARADLDPLDSTALLDAANAGGISSAQYAQLGRQHGRTLLCRADRQAFSRAARNQEIILGAFEEEGWPYRIDDPLPPSGNVEPKRRLHDTIKWLNRDHEAQVLAFIGDGTGEGVRWKSLVSNAVPISGNSVGPLRCAA